MQCPNGVDAVFFNTVVANMDTSGTSCVVPDAPKCTQLAHNKQAPVNVISIETVLPGG
jgi:hypothetical protein